jgi:hypothetical protein
LDGVLGDLKGHDDYLVADAAELGGGALNGYVAVAPGSGDNVGLEPAAVIDVANENLFVVPDVTWSIRSSSTTMLPMYSSLQSVTVAR